jgi:hypothetical protein
MTNSERAKQFDALYTRWRAIFDESLPKAKASLAYWRKHNHWTGSGDCKGCEKEREAESSVGHWKHMEISLRNEAQALAQEIRDNSPYFKKTVESERSRLAEIEDDIY